MPDYEPLPDPRLITQKAADQLLKYADAKQQLFILATHREDMGESERLMWARAYMMADYNLYNFEQTLNNSITRYPWTVHVAGAPGHDQNHACSPEENCDNPWCGIVQKCSRCHDVLALGYSGQGLVSEQFVQMMGSSIQSYMEHHFGENPVDHEGPTWYPVGTKIAKRTGMGGIRVFLVEKELPLMGLGPDEPLIDCGNRHEEIIHSFREGASSKQAMG